MSWVNIGVAGASAVMGVKASGDASDSVVKGGKNALAEQQRQYNTGLTMLEPTRALGYGALSDIGNLYGYKVPAYTPLSAIQGGYGSGPIGVKANSGGSSGGGSVNGRLNPLNALPGGSLSALGAFGHKDPLTKQIDKVFGGGEVERYGGTINPATGTVDVKGRGAKADDLMTEYLRTGEWGGGGKGKKYRSLMQMADRLRDNGYEYSPETATLPTAPDQAQAAAVGTSADGTAGNMSRFFASPDYEFRRSESLRGLERSAAARGGALGGNQLRAATELGGNLAAGEYGAYFNRLMSMAGLGQTATTQANNAGQTYANNAGQLQQNIGDSRASGIIGSSNALMGGANTGMNLWMMQRLLGGGNTPTPTPAPSYSPYGPYSGGYRLPGG